MGIGNEGADTCACVCQLRQVVYPVVNFPIEQIAPHNTDANTPEEWRARVEEHRQRQLATEGCPRATIEAAAGGDQALLKALSKSIPAPGWEVEGSCWHGWDGCNATAVPRKQSSGGVRALSVQLVCTLAALALLVVPL